MSIAYAAGIVSGSSGTGTSAGITFTGTPSRQLLVAVVGVEGVGAGSGPWVVSIGDGSSLFGWERVCYVEPASTGNGHEVWVSVWGSGVGTQTWNFGTSRSYVADGSAYTGQYDSGDSPKTGGTIRAATTAQVSGNNPNAPSVYVYRDELVVPVGCDQLASPGFGTPSGFTTRFDDKRTSFGNVEITLADKIAIVEGATGLIPWTATASSGSTKGTTTTLAVRPAAAVVAATSPYALVEFPVPA